VFKDAKVFVFCFFSKENFFELPNKINQNHFANNQLLNLVFNLGTFPESDK
jgi:hypothetical protein